jgi:alpha/beta superfamily hydrolase
MSGEIQTVSIESSGGALEGLLNVGSPDATYAAVVCHPHPMYGGTMHNKVVYHAMKALNGFGFPVLRFNFRGAGRSEGEHDFGRGEQDDVRAGIAWLRRRFELPMIFAGFSFGASVGLSACCDDADVKALISIGTPLEADDRHYRYDFLAQCPHPKLFISGARDQYGPAAQLMKLVDSVAEPKRLVLVEGADHFFEPDGLPKMRAAIDEWVRELSIRGEHDQRV